MAGLNWTPGPPIGSSLGAEESFPDDNGGVSPIPSVGFFPTGSSQFTELYLPAPIKGDLNQLMAQGGYTRNRQGETVFHIQGMTLYKLILTFTHLNNTIRPLVETFLTDSNGLWIDYVDQRGDTYRGLILNPDAKVVQVGRESHNISLDFEGVLV